jgi:hypothetical protein
MRAAGMQIPFISKDVLYTMRQIISVSSSLEADFKLVVASLSLTDIRDDSFL